MTPPFVPPAASPSRRPRRRWPPPSLRGLMILVVVVALPVGWAANTIRAQRAAVATVRAAGGTVEFDWTRDPNSPNGRSLRKEPAAPRWLRRWLGDELFQAVTLVRFRRPVPPEALPGVMAAVEEIAQLEDFTLAGATGLGAGLRHLRGKRRLESVWLAGPDITDAMLADLAALPSLHQVILGLRPDTGSTTPDAPDRSPSDAAFAGLAALRGLQYLAISQCPNLTDATLARLVAALPRLQTLRLTTWPGSPAATIAALARHHPDLIILSLDRTGATDDDLRPAAAFTRLRSLRLPSTRITDAGLAHLVGLTQLRSLSVASNRLTDAALPPLGRLTRLQNLGLLGNPAITDAGLAALRPLTGLRDLSLDGTGVTPAGVAALRAALPALRTPRARPVPAPTIPVPSPK